MTNKREKEILDALNAYRSAIVTLHDEEIGSKSSVWYENGYCYILVAQRLDDGSIYVPRNPIIVRLQQFKALLETLNHRIQCLKEEKNDN